MERVPRTNSRYSLRSRRGRGGNREHSAPTTATPPTSKVRHPSQLQEVKHCEDTRPNDQLETSTQQHRDLSRASAQVTLHTILTRRALEKTSLNSHHQDQAWATGIHGASALGILFSSIDVGSVFTTNVKAWFVRCDLHVSGASYVAPASRTTLGTFSWMRVLVVDCCVPMM
eukprot:1155250-Pelagomonas_calceolata.AAC.2